MEKRNKNCVLELPEEIQFFILNDWLLPHEVNQLILAATSKANRRSWLRTIYNALSPNYQVTHSFVHCSEEVSTIKLNRKYPNGCSDDDEPEESVEKEINELIENDLFSSHLDCISFEELEESAFTLIDFFANEFSYSDLHALHIQLINLLKQIFILNDHHLYHTDIKPSNVEFNGKEMKILLKNWTFSTEYTENYIRFPKTLKHRSFQFNLPFSSILYTELFYQRYTNYLRNEPQQHITSTSLRPFVIDYLNTFFHSDSFGLGDYSIIHEIMMNVYEFNIPDLNDQNRSKIIDTEVTKPSIVDYLVHVLLHYTRFRADGSLNLRPYLSEVYLPCIDLWGFLSIYFPLMKQLADCYYSLKPIELTLFKQLQFMIDSYLFSLRHEPINREELVEDMNKITKILLKLMNSSSSSSSARPTMMKMRERERERRMTRVFSICPIILSSDDSSSSSSPPLSSFSPLIASAGSDSLIKLWTISSKECVRTLRGHSNYVTDLVQLPSSGYLVSASHDTTIKVWDLMNIPEDTNGKDGEGRTCCLQTIPAHDGPIIRLFLLSDGRLASASSDRTVKIWNLLTWQVEIVCGLHEDIVLSLTEWKVPGHWDYSNGLSSSTSYLITGTDCQDSQLRFWNLSTGECAKTFALPDQKGINYLLALENGSLAIAGGDHHIEIWEFKIPDNHSSEEKTDSFLNILPKHHHNHLLHHQDDLDEKNVMVLIGHRWEVTCLLEVRSVRKLISSSIDHSIRIWNIRTGQCDRILQHHESVISCLKFFSLEKKKDNNNNNNINQKNEDTEENDHDCNFPSFVSCAFDGMISLWSPNDF